MEPVAHKFLARAGFRLRDLGFMMGEDVVDAAAMDIDLWAEEASRHRAALDVPAGATSAPRALQPTFPSLHPMLSKARSRPGFPSRTCRFEPGPSAATLPGRGARVAVSANLLMRK